MKPFLGLLVVVTLAGCEDVRPGQPASALEREAAYELIAQLNAIVAQPTAAVDVLQATSFAPVSSLVAPPGTPMAVPAGAAGDDELGGCVIATETSVTYSQCGLADHVVDGIWSAQLSRIHTELVDVFVVGPGVHGSVAVEANLAVGHELSGTLDTAIMWSMNDSDYVLDARLRIDNLVIDGPRCATSGSITLTGALGDATASSTQTLWFGPGCHDVMISR